MFPPLSGAALWTSFQDDRRKLVEQMCDLESAMALVTSAKAAGIQQAEETCHRYKVELQPHSHTVGSTPNSLTDHDQNRKTCTYCVLYKAEYSQ